MPAEVIQLRQSDREIQSIFSVNLRSLMTDQPSVTRVCKELQINRTQFNRYLSGEVSPRPLILARICAYFDVDARVLLEPLDTSPYIKVRDKYNELLVNILRGTMMPVSTEILPDGLYSEWKYSFQNPGQITFHVVQISTEGLLRRVRVKTDNQRNPIIKGVKAARRKVEFYGLAFNQPGGFGIIDRTTGSEFQTYSTFRADVSIHGTSYTGLKLMPVLYLSHLTHGTTPVILEPLPEQTGALLAAARTPRSQHQDDVPSHVKRILAETGSSGLMSSSNALWPKKS